MSDPRRTLMRDGVAALSLQGLVEAGEYRETTAMRCIAGHAAIHGAPDAASLQDDQIVFGEAFDVLLEDEDFLFGQARRDGYVGYVAKAALAPGYAEPTHWVSALRTYAFSGPDLKSAPALTLTMNSLVVAEDREGRFVKVADAGWVFGGHLLPIGVYREDMAQVAAQFLGAPYLWGGRDSEGLDCSGLVQQALYACGRAGPRDSDMQVSELGRAVDGNDPARGDLVFWEGHVGLMLDETRLLHANAHHMHTEIEALNQAISRIAAFAGEPTAFKRL